MQKEEVGRKISLCSDIRKVAANVQGKGRRQREREDEKRIKREEREKKRKLNEEPKMKRMQERSDKQKKKDEEKQQKVQACPKKHKRKCTNATAQFTKRRLQKKESAGATGPGKSGLECSRCRARVLCRKGIPSIC